MGAAYHKGKSRGDYATPWEFIQAVEARFGKIGWDLAATAENTKCGFFLSPEEDSLSVDWNELPLERGEIAWLNPPYGNITPWAWKCSESTLPIVLLVPASVDSEWFFNFVYQRALVMPLRGDRLSFDGKHSYPKPLMLCAYRAGVIDGFEPWKWRDALVPGVPRGACPSSSKAESFCMLGVGHAGAHKDYSGLTW